jgi:hypothetical protein
LRPNTVLAYDNDKKSKAVCSEVCTFQIVSLLVPTYMTLSLCNEPARSQIPMYSSWFIQVLQLRDFTSLRNMDCGQHSLKPSGQPHGDAGKLTKK